MMRPENPIATVATASVTGGPLSGSAWTAEACFTELYTLHYRRLVHLAWLLVRDLPTAEEVVQDAFVSVNGAWQRLRDAENGLAYVRQAVVNRSHSVLRRKRVADRITEQAPPDMPSAEYGALVSLERATVVAALQHLTSRQREAIVLRYYADLSEGQIAAAMGISRGAVKSHLARGMAALRAALGPEQG
jgi:RNA polymerase sigma-70 factor (sigma-E family)